MVFWRWSVHMSWQYAISDNLSTYVCTWWRTFWWWLSMIVLDWRWRPFEQSTPRCYIDVHLICTWEVLSLLLEDFSLSLELRFPWYHGIQKLNLKSFTKIFFHDSQCTKFKYWKMLTVTEDTCNTFLGPPTWKKTCDISNAELIYGPVLIMCALHQWHKKY